MIVTTGKHIKIKSGTGPFGCTLERTAESPGMVSVSGKGSSENNPFTFASSTQPPTVIYLPANKEESEAFIKAYRRICAESIEYRDSEVE